jgi:Ser/Thr protein kinase RdoA (MazF antagonist)
MVSATPLVSASPLTRLPRSYLVVVRGGAQVKIRFGRRAVMAARAAALSTALADGRVPPPLARAGRVTAEAWFPGPDLASFPLADRHLAAAADLLASLHRFPGPAGERLPRLQSAGPIHGRAERQLADLVGAGVVARPDGRSLRAILGGLPDRSPWGLTHRDYCGENLVWRSDDTVVSVDHETLGRGFIEYDVARTWYRWSLSNPARRRFGRAYRAAVGSDPPAEAELRAWRAAAAVKGTHLRHRRGLDAGRGLAALRAVLDAGR